MLYGFCLACHKVKRLIKNQGQTPVTPFIDESRQQQSENTSDPSNQYNNVTANLDLSKIVINGLIINSLLFYLYTTMKDWEGNVIQPVILGFIIPYFAVGFIAPLKIVHSSKSIWYHVKTNCSSIFPI